MAVETLTAELVGKSSGYTAMMQGAIAQADSWGAAMQKAGLAAAAALAGGVGSSVGAFMGFDKAMVESTAIMGDMVGLTDETQKKMRDLAISLGMEGTKSAEEMARAYFYLASAGLNAEQSMAALPGMMKFAQAGAFDMALATDLATDAMSALGLTVLDDNAQLATNLQRVSDVIVRANTLANASTQQFAEALTKDAGTTMKVYNKSIEEGVAVLAAYADQGIKAALAGGMFGRMMRYMGQSAIKNAAAHEKYGVAVFDEAGNFRNLADIFADLEKAMGPVNAKQRMERLKEMGFQVLAQRAVLPLIGTSERMRGYQKALETTSSGFSEKVAGRQMAALSNQFKNLWNVVQVAGIELGQQFAPALSYVVAQVKEGVQWWRALSGETKLYVGLAAAAYVAIMSVGPALAVVKFGLMALLAPAAAVLGPTGLLITGVAVAAAAMLNWSGTWDDVASSAGLTALAVGGAVVAFRVLWGVLSALKVVQIAQLGLWLAGRVALAGYTAILFAYQAAVIAVKAAVWAQSAVVAILTAHVAAASAAVFVLKVAMSVLGVGAMAANAAVSLFTISLGVMNAAIAGVALLMNTFLLGGAIGLLLLAVPAVVAIATGAAAAVAPLRAMFGALGESALYAPAVARVRDLFGEWRDILGDIVGRLRSGDMAGAWAVVQASAALAVAQMSDLFPPLWQFITEGFAAAFRMLGTIGEATVSYVMDLFRVKMERAKHWHITSSREAELQGMEDKARASFDESVKRANQIFRYGGLNNKGLFDAVENLQDNLAKGDSPATQAARQALSDVRFGAGAGNVMPWADSAVWAAADVDWLDDENWKTVKKNATDAIVAPIEEAKKAAQGLNAVLFGGAEAQQRIEAYRAALMGAPEAGGRAKALDEALSDLDGGTNSSDVVDTLEDIRDLLKNNGTPVNVLGADLL